MSVGEEVCAAANKQTNDQNIGKKLESEKNENERKSISTFHKNILNQNFRKENQKNLPIARYASAF